MFSVEVRTALSDSDGIAKSPPAAARAERSRAEAR
jgi:hypothetical protein